MGSNIVFLTVILSTRPCVGSNRNVVFFATSSRVFLRRHCKVHMMDLETKHVTDLISYPEGPYNRGGGPTGICFMGDYLYWGDQTTATVHRAKLTGGTLTEHD